MQYKVIADIREFKLLEPEWNLIFDRNTYSVFQSFVFNYYSWKEILTHSSSNSLFIIKIFKTIYLLAFSHYIMIKQIHCDLSMMFILIFAI